MIRPTRLSSEELEAINKKYVARNSLERDDYWSNIYALINSIPALIAHIEAFEKEIKDICKTRNELHQIVTEQAILLHQLERK